MPLQKKEGDLFAHATPECVIVHGVNCQGKMNSGFAKQLRERFPDAYKTYKTAETTHGLILGDINGYVDSNGFTIINAITQDRYGRDKDVVYVDYEAVEKSMNIVAGLVFEKGGPDYPLHLPFIGAGLANGDEAKLLEIFETAFKDVNATLWLHKP